MSTLCEEVAGTICCCLYLFFSYVPTCSTILYQPLPALRWHLISGVTLAHCAILLCWGLSVVISQLKWLQGISDSSNRPQNTYWSIRSLTCLSKGQSSLFSNKRGTGPEQRASNLTHFRKVFDISVFYPQTNHGRETLLQLLVEYAYCRLNQWRNKP